MHRVRVDLPWRAFVALLAPLILGGCVVTQAMLAANVARAAYRASLHYAEASRPTPDQAWARARLDGLHARAANGDPEAQYRLGQHYTRLAQPQAWGWTCLAAHAGHPRARLQLGHWYSEDRREEDPWPFLGIRPDDREALLWYRLAEAEGAEEAALFRDALLRRGVIPEMVALAEGRAEAWVKGSCGGTPLFAGTAVPAASLSER